MSDLGTPCYLNFQLFLSNSFIEACFELVERGGAYHNCFVVRIHISN